MLLTDAAATEEGECVGVHVHLQCVGTSNVVRPTTKRVVS